MFVGMGERMRAGESKINVENFILETWMKEIQTLQQVAQKARGLSIPTDV